MGCLMGRECLPPNHLQPHPRPLSEWRGEWILLVGWERMVSGNRGNCILELRKQPLPRPLSEWRGEWILLVGWERMVSGDRGNCILKLRKRPSRLQKGVSSLWREPFFTPTKRPLYLQTMVFTPLSITSLRSVTAGSERERGFPSFANNGLHSPLHSERGWGRGCSWAGGEAVVGLGERLSFR